MGFFAHVQVFNGIKKRNFPFYMEGTQPSYKTFIHLYFYLCPKLYKLNVNLHYVNKYVAKECEELTIRCQISITVFGNKNKKDNVLLGGKNQLSYKASTILFLFLFPIFVMSKDVWNMSGVKKNI